MAPSRTSRIAHWIGVMLALPLAAFTAMEVVNWTRGGYPPTVGISEVLFVVVAAIVAMLTIYAVCRAVGFLVVRLNGETSR